MLDEYLKPETCKNEEKKNWKSRVSKLRPRPMPVFLYPTHRPINLIYVRYSQPASVSSCPSAECHTTHQWLSRQLLPSWGRVVGSGLWCPHQHWLVVQGRGWDALLLQLLTWVAIAAGDSCVLLTVCWENNLNACFLLSPPLCNVVRDHAQLLFTWLLWLLR